jgi:hypothetical protein
MKDVAFYLPKYDAAVVKYLERVPKIATQKKLYANTIELFPSRQVEPNTGYGNFILVLFEFLKQENKNRCK